MTATLLLTDGDLVTSPQNVQVSVSQLGKVTGKFGCLRKWALGYLWGIKPIIEPRALREGKAFHRYVETALRGQTQPLEEPAQTMLENGWEHLPTDNPAIEIERRFLFPLIPGVDMQGYRDWVVPGVQVGDHKTTSGKALTSAALQRDPQANVYAHAEFLRNPQLEDIEARWVYYHKKPPHRAWPVIAHITPEHARTTVTTLHEPARGVALMRATVDHLTDDPNQIPADLTACGGCGRWCDVEAVCNKQPGLPTQEFFTILKARKDGTPMNLIDKLKANRDANPSTAPVNQPEAEAAALQVQDEVEPPAPTPAKKARRKRRTKAEIAADEAKETPPEETKEENMMSTNPVLGDEPVEDLPDPITVELPAAPAGAVVTIQYAPRKGRRS